MIDLRYRGSLKGLQNKLAAAVHGGEWSLHNHGSHWQCRRPDRAILNWWPTTGTILCQGPDAARDRMIAELQVIFAPHPESSQYADENAWWDAPR